MISTNLGRRVRAPFLALLPILAALLLAAPASAEVTIDEGNTTVSTSKLNLDFGNNGGTVEWLSNLKWRDSADTLGGDLAAESGVVGGGCGGAPGEFWGQSYGNEDSKGPGAVVAGARGDLGGAGHSLDRAQLAPPTACSGDTPPIPVRTRYTFFDSGDEADMVRVDRRWSFAFNQLTAYSCSGDADLRATALSAGTYNQEIYPKGDGSALVTEGLCDVCLANRLERQLGTRSTRRRRRPDPPTPAS